MTQTDEQTALAPADAPAPANPLRGELIVGSILLAVGLFALPALIYWVGTTLLGGYGLAADAGIGTFYGDFFGDLATLSGRAWTLALGPLVIISLLRLIFLRRRHPDEPPVAPRAGVDTAPPRRVEPRIG